MENCNTICEGNYKKGGGSAGISGTTFQIQLIAVILLNALKKLKDWKLSTENKEAGKFDDMVLEWPGHAILLQAKHKQTRRVTFDNLFSANSKNSDFSVPKYFLGYQEIKSKFQVTNLIICTNAPCQDDKIGQVINRESINSDNLLYCEGYDCSFSSFKEECIPLLKERIQDYLKDNRSYSQISEETVTDQNIKDFLEHLQIFDKYPSNLDNVIEQTLLNMKFSSNIFCKIFSQDVISKITDWFKQRKGKYLTEDKARGMFCEIRSYKYCQILNEYCVLFQRNDIDFRDKKNTIHIIAGGHLLQTIKIFRALQSIRERTLFINPNEDTEMKKQVIDAFQSPDYEYLIIIWPKLTQETVVREISGKLREILRRYPYKKIILIDEHDNKLIRRIQPNFNEVSTLNLFVTFDDLTEDTRDRLLNKKTILFQGERVSPKELLGTQTAEGYTEAINTEILEKLIRGEEIKVGTEIQPLDRETESCYINRQFTREIEEDEREGQSRTETFSEANIFDVDDKFVILSNECGSGKSTVLSHLAIAVKRRYPHLWVIKIDLDKCKDALKRLKRIDEDERDVSELLDADNASNLETQFRKFVFSIDKKVAVMFDGVDEVTDYTDIVCSLLIRCRRQRNFAKVFVTTRAHAGQELEHELDVTSFTLLPFQEQNYVDFFVKFWTLNFEVSDPGKCRRYAEILVRKLRSWRILKFRQGDHLVIVPRELEMLAKIFQEKNGFGALNYWEGCKEFLEANGSDPRLPRRVNIIHLYEMLIEKEQGEENWLGNEVARQTLIRKYKECLDFHKRH